MSSFLCKVLLLDGVSARAETILKDSNCEVTVIPHKMSELELIEMVPLFDAIIIRSATNITENVILKAKERLRVIARAGVGVDNINIRAATAAGILVINSPDGNTVAAAEHTFALMLSLSRYVPQADHSVRSGNWERSKFVGTQLSKATLGIIGLGHVGSHVAKIARAFGMTVIATDPFVTQERAGEVGCSEIVSLEKLLTKSDFVSLHLPLIPSTAHLINADKLAMMKSTARIINCSRGGVVDELALCDALNNGRLAGAALDVFEHERAFAKDDPLVNCKNLVLTPHLGASTAEAQVDVAIDVANQLLAIFAAGGIYAPGKCSPVNIKVCDPEFVKSLNDAINCAVPKGIIGSSG